MTDIIARNISDIDKRIIDLYNELKTWGYDDNYPTTKTMTKFIHDKSGTCIDYSNYVCYKLADLRPTIYHVAYKYFDEIEPYSAGNHMFPVFPGNIYVELAYEPRKGIVKFNSIDECLRTVENWLYDSNWSYDGQRFASYMTYEPFFDTEFSYYNGEFQKYYSKADKKFQFQYKSDHLIKFKRPMTFAELTANYGKAYTGEKLQSFAETWRMQKGIELICPQKTLEEQIAMVANFTAMTKEQRKISDAKSIELFGKKNLIHNMEIMVRKFDIPRNCFSTWVFAEE
jgi:hypothetical protein